jgi:hypothetical protein
LNIVFRWILYLLAGTLFWAGGDFLFLAISKARSGLSIADYGSTLILSAVLLVVGGFVVTKFYPRKRGRS